MQFGWHDFPVGLTIHDKRRCESTAADAADDLEVPFAVGGGLPRRNAKHAFEFSLQIGRPFEVAGGSEAHLTVVFTRRDQFEIVVEGEDFVDSGQPDSHLAGQLHHHIAWHIAVLVLDLMQNHDQVPFFRSPPVDVGPDILPDLTLNAGAKRVDAIPFDFEDFFDFVGDGFRYEPVVLLNVLQQFEEAGLVICVVLNVVLRRKGICSRLHKRSGVGDIPLHGIVAITLI